MVKLSGMRELFNGIQLNYEVFGEGFPIVLLHGNGEDHTIFMPLIEELSKEYKVYAIDSRSHGKSDEGKLDYYLMAEDVKCFIESKLTEQPLLYGFSDGGIISLIVAHKYPELVSYVVSSGANLTPRDLSKPFRFYCKLRNVFKPDQLYTLMLTGPNITKDDLAKIKAKTLILAGEKDIITKEHSEFIKNNVSNAELKILKGETHGSYVVNSKKLYPILKEFIK